MEHVHGPFRQVSKLDLLRSNWYFVVKFWIVIHLFCMLIIWLVVASCFPFGSDLLLNKCHHVLMIVAFNQHFQQGLKSSEFICWTFITSKWFAYLFSSASRLWGGSRNMFNNINEQQPFKILFFIICLVVCKESDHILTRSWSPNTIRTVFVHNQLIMKYYWSSLIWTLLLAFG